MDVAGFMLAFLPSLVWGCGTVMFKLSGFYCRLSWGVASFSGLRVELLGFESSAGCAAGQARGLMATSRGLVLRRLWKNGFEGR